MRFGQRKEWHHAGGIDPKVDYAFKRVFGRDLPLNRRLLISLLHAVLRLPAGMEITDVQVLNPFHERESAADFRAIVDIKLRDQQGRQYTVEMQMVLHSFFSERLTYYWARLYPQSLATGQDYEVLRPTIHVCFLNDTLYPDHPEQYKWCFQLRDEKTPQVLLTDQMEIHILELPKFRRRLEEIVEPLEQWVYFLRHAEEMDVATMPAQLQVAEIREALQELEVMSHDNEEREKYEARLRVQRDESIRAKTPRIEPEAGFREGRKEGLSEGRKENLIEMVRRWQRRLKQTETSADELRRMTLPALEALEAELELALLGPSGP